MLGYESTALIALGITFIFSMIGTNTMLFLTGLATLDPSLEEAARIDGAGRWRIFRHITLPHLSRFIQLAFVMTVIAAFSALFSLIFVMTGGGPGYATTTMEFLIYQTGFNQAQFGTAALYGLILFVITARGRRRPTATDRGERMMSAVTRPTPPRPRLASATTPRALARSALFVAMIVMAVVMLYPFAVMIVTSFKTQAQYFSGRGSSTQSWHQLASAMPIYQECSTRPSSAPRPSR